jgi:hypothetical protein
MLLLLHHLLVVIRCAPRVSTVLVAALIVLIVVAAALVREVLRSLVFVRTAILSSVSTCSRARVSVHLRDNSHIEISRWSR